MAPHDAFADRTSRSVRPSAILSVTILNNQRVSQSFATILYDDPSWHIASILIRRTTEIVYCEAALRTASHYTILSLRRPAMAPTTPSPTGRRVVWDPLRFFRSRFLTIRGYRSHLPRSSTTTRRDISHPIWSVVRRKSCSVRLLLGFYRSFLFGFHVLFNIWGYIATVPAGDRRCRWQFLQDCHTGMASGHEIWPHTRSRIT